MLSPRKAITFEKAPALASRVPGFLAEVLLHPPMCVVCFPLCRSPSHELVLSFIRQRPRASTGRALDDEAGLAAPRCNAHEAPGRMDSYPNLYVLLGNMQCILAMDSFRDCVGS